MYGAEQQTIGASLNEQEVNSWQLWANGTPCAVSPSNAATGG
jgi:hypothetical protein